MTVAQSPNLGLNLIAKGTSNWGDLSNQNMDKIDNEINKLKTRIINISKVWETLNDTKQAIYSTPILTTFSDGTKVIVYQGWDWYIYAVRFDTGTLLWRYATGGNCYGRCQSASINGVTYIYGASHDGKIYCLNEQGQKVWEHKNIYDRSEATGTATSATSSTLVDTNKNWVANSFIRSSTNQGYNASITITSGTGNGQTLEVKSVVGNTITLWGTWSTIPDSTSVYKLLPKYPSDKFFQHAGTISQEGSNFFLYVTGFDATCTKINTLTGAVQWYFSSNENCEPFPVVTDINNDGILECLFVSVDGYAYCLNSSTGVLMWKTNLGGGNDAYCSYGDLENDGIIEFVVNSRADRCFILNGNDGSIKYQSTSVGGDIDTKPVLYDLNNDGKMEIVFGTDSNFVYCLDYKGNTLWRYNQGSVLNASSNVITVNNEILILSPDMNGMISVLSPYGVELGQIHMKGSIEGTPLIITDNGSVYMVTTTIDGYVTMWKFN